MKVIWKRPDGFHGASPSDYEVVQVAGSSKIWLHKSDCRNFPFRISGGWQDEDASTELNQLVNLLNKPKEQWLAYLMNGFHDSKAESCEAYLDKTQQWLKELQNNLKGDHWEIAIMGEVLSEVSQKLGEYTAEFCKLAGKTP